MCKSKIYWEWNSGNSFTVQCSLNTNHSGEHKYIGTSTDKQRFDIRWSDLVPVRERNTPQPVLSAEVSL